jgi:predicted amino acid racemase
MYPRVRISKEKYRNNIKVLKQKLHEKGISMMAVTKVFSADHMLVNILIEEEVDYLADSRIENIRAYPKTKIPKVLLRIPSIYETDDVVRYADISLNSEIVTMQFLNISAQKLGVKHGVILMVDLGDLREGIFDENELISTAQSIQKMEHIELVGIGTNLTCYGGVIPSTENLLKLNDYRVKLESILNIKLEIVSGGNSSSLDLLFAGEMPEGINNLRLGESLVLGRETAYGDFIDGTFDDVFILESDIIEVKEKPSVPIGQIGMNAFGKIPTFEDKGIRKRAIIAIGKQDVDHNELIPFDTIQPIGSSSDHIILDVTDGLYEYRVGSVIQFRLTYASILSLMTSKYVVKYYE